MIEQKEVHDVYEFEMVADWLIEHLSGRNATVSCF